MTLSLADFDELSLEGLEIGAIKLDVAQLTADFGAGFGAEASAGPASGLWGWELSSDALPDADAYLNTIEGKPRFQYYSEFFLDHTVGTRPAVFVIDFRGKKFHCSFDTKSISGQMHSYDVFSLDGVRLKMRRVPDIYYLSDGSIFDPANIPAVWGWFIADDLTIDRTDNGHDLDDHGNIVGDGGTVANGFVTSRFNGGATNTGYLNTAVDPTIYEAFFAIKINEATFSNNAGILTSSTGNAALLADDTATKLQNLGFGGTYSYKLNAVTLTEATQNMPMNVFGIVHARWSGGIALTNLQIGKDRGTAGTFLEADIGEIVLCDALLTTAESANMDAYLMRKWGIS